MKLRQTRDDEIAKNEWPTIPCMDDETNIYYCTHDAFELLIGVLLSGEAHGTYCRRLGVRWVVRAGTTVWQGLSPLKWSQQQLGSASHVLSSPRGHASPAGCEASDGHCWLWHYWRVKASEITTLHPHVNSRCSRLSGS